MKDLFVIFADTKYPPSLQDVPPQSPRQTEAPSESTCEGSPCPCGRIALTSLTPRAPALPPAPAAPGLPHTVVTPARDLRGAAGSGERLLLPPLVSVTDRHTRLVELGALKVFHNLNDLMVDSMISGSAMDTVHTGMESSASLSDVFNFP